MRIKLPISFMLFGLVGAITAGVYFLVFHLLWDNLGMNYQMAASVAYLLGVNVHFMLNRSLTFKSTGKMLPQIYKYVLMVIINYVITLLIVRFTVENLNLTPYLGIICSIVVTVMIGYLLSQFWIFKNTERVME